MPRDQTLWGTGPADIQVLTGMEAVRKRPAMYVGPLDAPDLANRLLQDALCMALDSACDGTCTRITIDIGKDPGSFSINDNGPGWSVVPLKSGLFQAEVILTQLHACRAAKEERQKNLCTNGIAVTNALSSSASISTFHDGVEWRQRYAKGEKVTPFERVQGVVQPGRFGTTLAFQLDRDFLPKANIDTHALVDWLLTTLAPGARAAVNDRREDLPPIEITPANPTP